MHILDQTEIVIGLFDSERDVEQTIAELNKLGLNQKDGDLELIDQDRLTSKIPLSSTPDTQNTQRAVGIGTAVGPTGVTRSEFVESPTLQQRSEQRLVEVGVAGEEATFFARHIARGSTVLVVKAGNREQADEVVHLMQAGPARVSRS